MALNNNISNINIADTHDIPCIPDTSPVKRTGDSLKFPDFDDIKVSTKTFIVMTNVLINLTNLFDYLKVSPYNFVVKKRGRKKKSEAAEKIEEINDGSIITVKFEKKIKGIDLKQRKNSLKKKKGKWFRNSLTVVMMLNNKPINLKVYKNGIIQITGCKIDEHVEQCVRFLWLKMKDNEVSDVSSFENEFVRDKNEDCLDFNNDDIYVEKLYRFTNDINTLVCYYIPAMRNMDFSVGFLIDREKLAKYMSTQTEFHSLLETSFGYTGVNIKLPIAESITDMKIKKSTYNEGENTWKDEQVLYQEYLDCLPKKDAEKKVKKKRYVTFLCFQSGKIIESAMNEEIARANYHYFIKIIRTSFDLIEERLDV